MAGEWIKLEHTLPEKPEVMRMARILKIDPDAVVGKLARLWGWIDGVSVDGSVDGVVAADVDSICRCDGFASACVLVGWLSVDESAERVTLPNFDNHNGETAKKRALKNRRQAKWRANVDEQTSTPASTAASTREEKRREEKKEQKQPVKPALLSELPDQLAADFAAVRKAKSLPLTETAIAGIRREAAKAGLDFETAIRVCCERGWGGFKAEWYLKDAPAAATPSRRLKELA